MKKYYLFILICCFILLSGCSTYHYCIGKTIRPGTSFKTVHTLMGKPYIGFGLTQKNTKLSWEDRQVSRLEAVLSRGDRRLGGVIRRAWELGCRFDTWREHCKYDNWLKAFDEAGLDPAFYAHRERAHDEILPWAHIRTGISDDFLKEEYRRTLEGKETADCRISPCNACGLEGLEICMKKHQ